jgi:hypothetical protein
MFHKKIICASFGAREYIKLCLGDVFERFESSGFDEFMPSR